MTTPGKRLRKAREDAGFRSARAAAQALGIPVSTYNSHERAGEPGARMYNLDEARTYGRRFKVDYLWLLTGEKFPHRQLPEDVSKAIEILSGLDGRDRELALAHLDLLSERSLGKKAPPDDHQDRGDPK